MPSRAGRPAEEGSRSVGRSANAAWSPTRTGFAAALLGVAVVAGSVGGPAAASPTLDPDAARKRTVDAQIDALRKDLNETDAALAEAVIALRRTEAQLPAVEQVLSEAHGRVAATDAAHAQAVQNLAVARADEQKARDQLADTRAEIATERTRVAQFASHVYMSQGAGGAAAVAAEALAPGMVAERLLLAETVMDLQSATLDKLATARATEVALEDRLRALRVEQEDAEQAAAQALSAAQDARDEAASAKAALDALAATQAKEKQQVSSKLAGEKTRLAEMEQESARLAAVLRARAEAAKRAAAEAARRAAAAAKAAAAKAAAAAAERARRDAATRGSAPRASSGGSSPAPSGGPLAWPLGSFFVTSEFGYRVHPIDGSSRLHAGIDVASTCGSPVYAAAAGSIVSAGWGGGYGNRVVIDHGLVRGVGLATSYNHMQSIAVHGGQVSRGQLIGYEGTTGYSTGCHVHFEVYENGAPVNPRGWL